MIKVVFEKNLFSTPSLGSTTVGSVSRPFEGQSRIRRAQVEREPSRHVPVVVEARQVHGQKETAELDVMLDQLVFQLPGV